MNSMKFVEICQFFLNNDRYLKKLSFSFPLCPLGSLYLATSLFTQCYLALLSIINIKMDVLNNYEDGMLSSILVL